VPAWQIIGLTATRVPCGWPRAGNASSAPPAGPRRKSPRLTWMPVRFGGTGAKTFVRTRYFFATSSATLGPSISDSKHLRDEFRSVRCIGRAFRWFDSNIANRIA
jgi:hypothetical protein